MGRGEAAADASISPPGAPGAAEPPPPLLLPPLLRPSGRWAWFTGALNGGGTQPSSTPRQTFRSCLIIMVDEREEDPGAVDEMNLMSRLAVP
ncbi:hypothetical protein ACRRTK_023590 [Alexandromys fortis]